MSQGHLKQAIVIDRLGGERGRALELGRIASARPGDAPALGVGVEERGGHVADLSQGACQNLAKAKKSLDFVGKPLS